MPCSCSTDWNDSFSKTVEEAGFVALIKVISFDEYLDWERYDDGSDEKIPYAMTVKIIQQYKGTETRKEVTILGDNGILCRPYLSDFELNGYYLIAPSRLDQSADTEFDFFACRTDYLKVDMETKTAHGNYSMFQDQVELETFEADLNGRLSYWMMSGVGLCILLIILIIIRLYRKNKKKYVPINET